MAKGDLKKPDVFDLLIKTNRKSMSQTMELLFYGHVVLPDLAQTVIANIKYFITLHIFREVFKGIKEPVRKGDLSIIRAFYTMDEATLIIDI